MTPYDRYLFHEGSSTMAYKFLGSRPCIRQGRAGVLFSLWAPNAGAVSVLTDGNGWTPGADPMNRSKDGVWSLFIPGAGKGTVYKYAVEGADGVLRRKSDPYALYSQLRPDNASVVWELGGYRWNDRAYMKSRPGRTGEAAAPMSVYEVHPGSWKKDPWRPDGFMHYRRLAEELAEYVRYMGFTHVELMGICEHPFDGSWGYQVSGYFSPTSRFGTPDDFRYFVDLMHQNGIGVILDWVPAHFPKDEFGLANLDGTALYEPEDTRISDYPEWGTRAFDFERPEVRSFLLSSALYWIREFHVDALRVDAVAAMLYSNYSRPGRYSPETGNMQDPGAIRFLKQLNRQIADESDAYLIAEDSSIMKGITEPVEEGGLGFALKWNLGWMNDTLKYFSKDPVYRRYHHGELTYTMDYAFTEKFILVLSHDEVVHLKKSLLYKFPGSIPEKLGGLKTLYTMLYTQPGKKLLFMGQEFAMEQEWSEARGIDFYLADDPWHRDVMDSVRALNGLYAKYPCLYSDTGNPVSFEWVNRNDADGNTMSYIRRNPWNYEGALLVICNLAPTEHPGYPCGVPVEGSYRRVFSTYDSLPGLQESGEAGRRMPVSEKKCCDGRENMIKYDLRAYESVILEIPLPAEK